MSWLRDLTMVGADLGKVRRLLWLGQCGTAALLVIALLAPHPLDSLITAATVPLIASQYVIARILAHRSVLDIAQSQRLFREAEGARQQIEQLFAMTDMLQSAENYDDAGAILEATANQLLSPFRGALYIFNNSHDRLDLVRFWPHDDETSPAEALVPGNCWALKRGKPHINDPKTGTLCCMHNSGLFSTLELPMIARGKVHGLLMLAVGGEDGTAQLKAITRMARALADSVSLALANIALQEKLRTQSLRDPLTGLYNRRYMEDALERYLSMAERSGSPTSVVMIDLDHFKALNDAHGHAKGDAVLRDVALQLVGGLRPSDVVSRYGGEELLVIMPGCNMDDAMLKAEVLRARIEGLGAVHGAPVSASFGVACVPDSASGLGDLVAMADTALYAAKQAGRNRVVAAKRRPVAERPRAAGSKISKLAVG